MFARALVVVAAGLTLAFDAKDDAIKADLKKLEGAWSLVAASERGQDAPKEIVGKIGMHFTFAGSKITVKLAGRDKPEQGPVTIDPTKNPKEIEFKTGDTPLRGIYALDGDTLKMCLVKDKDSKRPTDFTTAQDNKQAVFVFKRDKK